MADSNDPAERRRTAWMMFDYLSQAPVFLPLASPPPEGAGIVEVPATEEALKNIAVSIDTRSARTHSAMMMFLDLDSLAAKFPGCRYVSQPAKKVLEMFVASRYDSLFFNPEGQWSSWEKEQAAEALEAGRLGPG
jgi:hypothetical protein